MPLSPKRIIATILLSCTMTVIAFCQQDKPTTTPDLSSLRKWQAGVSVSSEAITAFGGIDACFKISTIPDDVWARMQGKTYKPNPTIGRDDLRYLHILHWDNDGKTYLGEMVCNKIIAAKLITIFKKLYSAKYPIHKMILPEAYDADDEKQMLANNTSCFCYRPVAGTNKLSRHSLGLAVDINPLYNPYYKKRSDGKLFVQPSTAAKYCDRTKAFPYKIDKQDLCYRLFTENGFAWGGAWKSCKDYQHFELKGK